MDKIGQHSKDLELNKEEESQECQALDYQGSNDAANTWTFPGKVIHLVGDVCEW